MTELLLVACAGVLAGAMNAMAGGGSFVSLPALIAFGVPSTIANASSTVALFPGGLASVWAYRRGLRPIASVPVRTMAAVTVTGGLIGGLLLILTPSRAFDVILPWLLLTATLAIVFAKQIGEALRRRFTLGAPVVLGVQFVLGLYGGYFGGAVGLMMLAAWGLLDGADPKSLNPPRTLMTSAANSASILLFIVTGMVAWAPALALLLGALAGGYGGALIGQRLPAAVVRGFTIFITATTTLVFFFRAFAQGI